MGRRTLAVALLLASAFGPMTVAQTSGDLGAGGAIWLGLLVQLGWLGFALGGALFTDEPVHHALGWVRGRLPAVAWIPAVLGFLCASFGVHQLLVELQLRDVGQLAEIDRSVRSSSAVTPWLAPMVAGLLPGLAEETLFRGFVLRRLQAVRGSSVALLGSAVVFGLAHLDWIHGTAALALGLYLGVLALAAGSVWPCVAAHGVNNLLGVLAIAGAGAGMPVATLPLSPRLTALLAIALAVVLLGATLALKRRAERQETPLGHGSSAAGDRPNSLG